MPTRLLKFDRLSHSGLWERGEIRSVHDLFLLIGHTHMCPSSWHVRHWVALKSQAEQVLDCTRTDMAHMFLQFPLPSVKLCKYFSPVSLSLELQLRLSVSLYEVTCRQLSLDVRIYASNVTKVKPISDWRFNRWETASICAVINFTAHVELQNNWPIWISWTSSVYKAQSQCDFQLLSILMSW